MRTAQDLRNILEVEEKNRKSAFEKKNLKKARKIIQKKCEPRAKAGFNYAVVAISFRYGRMSIANLLAENGYEVDLLRDRKIKIKW